MATLATLTGQVVAVSDPQDAGDTSLAANGVLNIKIDNKAGVSGFVTVEPVLASVLATASLGACTITITQP